MKRIVIMAAVALLLFATSCKKGDINLKQTSVELHKGETFQIDASSDKLITYTSQNLYHASVYATGLVKAQYVGATKVVLETEDDRQEFSVDVVPVSKLYSEPSFKIGASKEDVISEFGDMYFEQDGMMVYLFLQDNVSMFTVSLENNKVVGYSYTISTDYSNELSTFLNERYNFVTYSNDIYMYVNALSMNDATMAIGKMEYDSYWIVAYVDANMKSDIDKFFNFSRNLLNQ